MKPLLELTAIHFSYPQRPVLKGASFCLYPGERLALVGANGAGKSSLLQLMLGLKHPESGQILAFGQARRTEAEFRPLRGRIGLLFQDSDDQLFCPSVLEDVAFGPLNLGHSPKQARAQAEAVLERLGLSAFAERISYRLSAGEKRLVALATVLAMDPDILLLDEPNTGLDAQSEQRLLGLLKGLPQAMVIVSHDKALLAQLATRALLLKDGRLIEATLHSHIHEHPHIHAPGLVADHSHK
jgi:cobalt/nickel transport system ATP-binding protein